MKPRSNTRPVSGTRSVLRAISVLKTLGRSGSAYGITELGTATGLSKATVFRLLGALETEGMVSRDASTGRYRLGPELIALGASALSTSALRTVARDDLVRIAEESGEAATLEILSEGAILVVDEVQGRFLFGATPEIGRRDRRTNHESSRLGRCRPQHQWSGNPARPETSAGSDTGVGSRCQSRLTSAGCVLGDDRDT